MTKKGNFTTQYITRTAVLLALALVFQIGFRGAGQYIVGPLVNFVLIMSVYLVGSLAGVIVGCLTPLIAFFLGITPLFPIVPFIMVGNALYVIFFDFFKERIMKGGEYFSLVISSLIKYAFLTLTVRYVVTLFVDVKPPLVAAFSLPQLYTALIGGIIAIIVSKLLPKSMFLER